MENKINIARFKEGYRTAEVKGIWQWDYGQILRIQGLNLPTAAEIHFSLDEHGGEAVRRIGVTKDGVTDVVVPDTMLENESAYGDSYYFFAYIYLTDETSGNTEYKIRAKVSTRSKPEGYVSGGNDTFAEILKTVNEIAEDKVDIPAPAKVGQVLSVKATDESGNPTEFEAKDMSGGVSDEKIAEAFGAYMEAHPIEETDPTVPDWAKQPEKPSYTAEEVGALPNTTTTLPNPNTLTFTGAVTESYDGSSPIEINIPEGGGTGVTVDNTLSVAGKAADAKATGDAISSLSDDIANLPSGGSGLTDEQISAFDSFFSTLIGDEESKREKDKLIKLLKGIAIVNYTITLNGDNFSIDNDSREVEENQSWGANISFSDGFEAESITVLMGDDDVTETAVSGNTVAINSVTGNVVITIIAREITVPTTLLYSNDGVVFTDDSESLHTGVNLSEYAEFTILMNIKSLTNFMWGSQDIISSGVYISAVRFGKHGDGTFSISKAGARYTIPETVIAKKTSNFESSIPFALTFNSGVQKVYSFMDGAMTKTDDVANTNPFSKMGELIISPLMEEGYNMSARWLGEIANIKVYSEILSDSAIDEYMRGL